MNSPTLIQGATIFDGSGDPSFIADVLIAEGVIQKIGRSIPRDGCEVVEAAGKILTPGFINTHSHSELELFKDPRFQVDVRNTAIFTVLFVAGALLLGLFLAILLDQDLKGEPIFRTVFLLPMVTERSLFTPASSSICSSIL